MLKPTKKGVQIQCTRDEANVLISAVLAVVGGEVDSVELEDVGFGDDVIVVSRSAFGGTDRLDIRMWYHSPGGLA